MHSTEPARALISIAHTIADMPDAELRILFSDRFIHDSSPQLEIWKPVLPVIMPPEAIDAEFERFLCHKPPRVHESILRQYKNHLSVFSSEARAELWPRSDEGLSFNPAADMIGYSLEKRITRDDAVRAFAILTENPHPFLTIAALHSFFAGYVENLCDATLRHYHRFGERRFGRRGDAFKVMENTFGSNAQLFAGTMLIHLVLGHDFHARQQGREPGDLQPEDFSRFMEYANGRHLFTKKEDDGSRKVCPFTAQFRHAANEAGPRTEGVLLKGARLWRLHQIMAPVAEAQGTALKAFFNQVYRTAVGAFDVPAAVLAARPKTVRAETPSPMPPPAADS